MDENPERPSRRDVLKLAGTTATTGLLAGCSLLNGGSSSTSTPRPDLGENAPTADGETTPYVDRYRTVVDVVEAGADRGGDRPVDPVLREVLDDDTLIYFPHGRYRISEPLKFRDRSNVGFVGDRATLVPPKTGLGYWLVGYDVSDVRFEGFRLDHTAPGVGPQVQLQLTGGDSVIRDVVVRGFHDSKYIAFVTYVKDPNATLEYDRVRLPDGSSDVPAMYLGKPSVGRVVFRDCYVEHWSQGIYASPHSGPISVVGGEYANNNRAGIRLGGGRHGALVRDVYVRVDDPVPEKWVDRQNIRGIWLREGEGTRIENSRIEILNLAGVGSDAALMIGELMGPVTVRDTTVRMADGYNGIRTLPPAPNGSRLQAMDRLPDSWDVRCQNVRVDGDVDNDGNAIRLVGRNGSTLDRVEVEQTGAQRVGLYFGPSVRNCRVERGSVRTARYPLVAKRGTADDSGACSVHLSAETSLQMTGATDDVGRLYGVRDGRFCVNARPSVDTASNGGLPPQSVILGTDVRGGRLWGTVVGFDEYDDFYERNDTSPNRGRVTPLPDASE